jgi:hypothetical protein
LYALEQLQCSPSQVAIVFFGKNKKKLLQRFPISGCHLSQVGKNRLRAHICAQQSTAHPSVLEEMEGYKNNFIFFRIPNLSFQEFEG